LFICRIKAGTKKRVLSPNPVPADSIVFFDATVLLGTEGVNQSKTPLRLVGYEVDRVKYWVATNRDELTGEQIAQAYKLRWNIENFFACRKLLIYTEALGHHDPSGAGRRRIRLWPLSERK
jgi:hypothetical protein